MAASDHELLRERAEFDVTITHCGMHNGDRTCSIIRHETSGRQWNCSLKDTSPYRTIKLAPEPESWPLQLQFAGSARSDVVDPVLPYGIAIPWIQAITLRLLVVLLVTVFPAGITTKSATDCLKVDEELQTVPIEQNVEQTLTRSKQDMYTCVTLLVSLALPALTHGTQWNATHLQDTRVKTNPHSCRHRTKPMLVGDSNCICVSDSWVVFAVAPKV